MLRPPGSRDGSIVILRAASSSDVDALLDVQQEGAIRGLSHIFPQDQHPFPRAAIAARWRTEIAAPDCDVYLYTDDDGAIQAFAAMHGQELLHFGTAPFTWGTGLASDFHDALLATTASKPTTHTLRLHVFEENRRSYCQDLWMRDLGRVAPHGQRPVTVIAASTIELVSMPCRR